MSRLPHLHRSILAIFVAIGQRRIGTSLESDGTRPMSGGFVFAVGTRGSIRICLQL